MKELTRQEVFQRVVKNKNFDSKQLFEIKRGIDFCVDVEIYAKECYNACQMREIRIALENYTEPFFADPRLSWEQMNVLRKAERDGYNMRDYIDPSIPYEELQRILDVKKKTEKRYRQEV